MQEPTTHTLEDIYKKDITKPSMNERLATPSEARTATPSEIVSFTHTAR